MKNELITYEDPKSPISEVFRALRTNIQFKNSGRNLKTILVTSTVKSEGKSVISANLAIAFAQTGKKVLIVDTDMRKSRQHTLFSVMAKPGLSNYLSGIDHKGETSDYNIYTYIKQTEIDNLDILPAGTIPPNPSELLALDKMAKTIEKLKKNYDLIIFDGAPGLLVTDSIILSRIMDSTLLVVSYREAKKEEVKKVQREIENVGGKLEGAILNKVPTFIGKYKDKYYYGHEKMTAEQSIIPPIIINNEPNVRKKRTKKKEEKKEIESDETVNSLVTYDEPKSKLILLIQTILKQMKINKNS